MAIDFVNKIANFAVQGIYSSTEFLINGINPGTQFLIKSCNISFQLISRIGDFLQKNLQQFFKFFIKLPFKHRPPRPCQRLIFGASDLLACHTRRQY